MRLPLDSFLLARRLHSYLTKKSPGAVMTTDKTDRAPLEEPLAALERELITAYITGAGQDLQHLLTQDDAESRSLLAAASQYATARLAEVETRLHYLRSLRGEV